MNYLRPVFSRLLIIISLIGAASVFSQSDASAATEKLAKLAELNFLAPWTLQATPHFLLYADGRVLYFSDAKQNDRRGLKLVQLEAAELAELKQVLVLTEGFRKLEPSYEIEKLRDTGFYEVVLHDNQQSARVRLAGWNGKNGFWFRQKIPSALSRVVAMMVDYEHPRGRKWSPEYMRVELTSRDGSRSPEAKIQEWPKDWPEIHAAAVAQGKEQIWQATLYLSTAKREEFQKLLPPDLYGQEHYISANGRFWSGHWDYVYPDEAEKISAAVSP